MESKIPGHDLPQIAPSRTDLPQTDLPQTTLPQTEQLAESNRLLTRQWYAVALSQEVTRKPLAVKVLGERYVLYRQSDGTPTAHLDRCPHRNVPLSLGRCLPDDTIECPYHGWRFGADGACKMIPGQATVELKTRRVQTFATCETYGIVWLCPDSEGRAPLGPPLHIAEASDSAVTCLSRRVHFPAGLHAVVENALDVPHTSVLHQGLFRSGERKPVDVTLRRYSTWAEAEFVGEPPPGGIVARFLTMGEKKGAALTVQHWDRFSLPSVLQVEYRLGARAHFLISGFCTPRDDGNTDVFAVVCLRTPLFRFLEKLLVRFVEPFAMRVVRQDQEILGHQTEALEHFGGPQFMSTDLDVLGNSVSRLLKDAKNKEQRDPAAALDLSLIPRERGETPREITETRLLA